MKIVIIGCGNVGRTLAQQLAEENHDVTVVDTREDVLESVVNTSDVLGIAGNGASLDVLEEADIEHADLLIAVTGMDELNLLCCMIAKKVGNCNTIARVSNPVYSRELGFIKDKLEISMIINPHQAAARTAARLFKFPSALKIDTFVKSRVELVSIRIDENNPICDTKLKDMTFKLDSKVLISIVERGEEVIIPDGNFEIKAKDIITIVATSENIREFMKKLELSTVAAKNVMIAGGGRFSLYLAEQLLEMGLHVKVIERDDKRCEELLEMLPQASIICGDATEKDLLIEEGLTDVDAFVSSTNFDEENVMLTLYAKSVSDAKLLTKIHRISYDEIIEQLDIGSTIYPKHVTAENIIKYVRAMSNSMGSNIETLHRLCDNRVEALEFNIKENSPVVGVCIKDLDLKPNVLIVGITHKGKVHIAQGNSVIQAGDSVVIITTNTGLDDIGDILA